MESITKRTLKNGKELIMFEPRSEYAEMVVEFIKSVNMESLFLGRDTRDVMLSVDEMRENLDSRFLSDKEAFFIGTIDGEMVLECFVKPINNRVRFTHRAIFGIVVLQKWWGLGIGRIATEECINWSRMKGYEQLELETTTTNKIALNLYKDLGFEICGMKKNSMKYADGSYADEYSMVIYFTLPIGD